MARADTCHFIAWRSCRFRSRLPSPPQQRDRRRSGLQTPARLFRAPVSTGLRSVRGRRFAAARADHRRASARALRPPTLAILVWLLAVGFCVKVSAVPPHVTPAYEGRRRRTASCRPGSGGAFCAARVFRRRSNAAGHWVPCFRDRRSTMIVVTVIGVVSTNLKRMLASAIALPLLLLGSSRNSAGKARPVLPAASRVELGSLARARRDARNGTTISRSRPEDARPGLVVA